MPFTSSPIRNAFPERILPSPPGAAGKGAGEGDLFIALCTHQNVLASFGGNR